MIPHSIVILWELKEEWLNERTTLFAFERHLGVVISEKIILVVDGHPHDIDILDSVIVEVDKSVWLLVNSILSVVVSREWVERPDNVPSGAKFSGGVSDGATNI